MVKMRPEFEDGNRCDFHSRKKGIPVTAVAEIVDRVIRDNYGFGEYVPDIRPDSDKVDYVQKGADLEEVVGRVDPG